MKRKIVFKKDICELNEKDFRKICKKIKSDKKYADEAKEKFGILVSKGRNPEASLSNIVVSMLSDTQYSSIMTSVNCVNINGKSRTVIEIKYENR